MTPEEQQLVDELFDRLAQVENNPRDSDAERAIANGVRRAPHATYALVQTALVMDEALKRANARIEELQAQVGGERSNSSKAASSTACATPCLAGTTRAVPYPMCAPKPRSLRQRRALSVAGRISPADAALSCGSGHGPGLWIGRIVSRHGRIDGGGGDRRRAPA